MHKKQLIVIWVMGLSISLLLLFPPRLIYKSQTWRSISSFGYYRHYHKKYPYYKVKIDWGNFFRFATLIIITGGLLLSLPVRKEETFTKENDENGIIKIDLKPIILWIKNTKNYILSKTKIRHKEVKSIIVFILAMVWIALNMVLSNYFNILNNEIYGIFVLLVGMILCFYSGYLFNKNKS